MMVTLLGTYDSEWTVNRDDVVAIKTSRTRAPAGGALLSTLRLFLKPEAGMSATGIWLLDCASNRDILGMPQRKNHNSVKEEADPV